MATVLLQHAGKDDPIGEKATLEALRTSLEGHSVRQATRGGLRGLLCEEGRNAEGLVFAGGSVFGPGRGGSSPRRAGRSDLEASLLALLAPRRKTVAFLGVSAGGGLLPSQRRVASRMVKHSDLFLLAEEASASLFAAAGVPAPIRVSADPAWVGLTASSAAEGRGDTAAVILDSGSLPGIDDRLVRGLGTVARRGMRIRLQPWDAVEDRDRAWARRMAELLRADGAEVEIGPPIASLPEACDSVADTDVVITMRYRGLHAAATAGVPAVAIGLEPRIEALAGRLGQHVAAPTELAESLWETVCSAADTGATSPSAVKEEVARAEGGLSLLRLVLQRGDVEPGELEGLPLAPDPWL